MITAEFIQYIEGLQKSFSPDKPLTSPLDITFLNGAKTVLKPWGFEIWLVHDAKLPYALKLLYLKAGTKTSLQYHRQKMEHHVVFSGEIILHFQARQTDELRKQKLGAGAIIKMEPGVIHRLEALTDTLFIEVSSQYLEDVVRIEDDYGRIV